MKWKRLRIPPLSLLSPPSSEVVGGRVGGASTWGSHGDGTLPEMSHRQHGLTPAPHLQPIMSHANEQDSRPTHSSWSRSVIHIEHEAIRVRGGVKACWSRLSQDRQGAARRCIAGSASIWMQWWIDIVLSLRYKCYFVQIAMVESYLTPPHMMHERAAAATHPCDSMLSVPCEMNPHALTLINNRWDGSIRGQ